MNYFMEILDLLYDNCIGYLDIDIEYFHLFSLGQKY